MKTSKTLWTAEVVGMFQELGGAGDDDTVLAKLLCWLTGVKI